MCITCNCCKCRKLILKRCDSVQCHTGREMTRTSDESRNSVITFPVGSFLGSERSDVCIRPGMQCRIVEHNNHWKLNLRLLSGQRLESFIPSLFRGCRGWCSKCRCHFPKWSGCWVSFTAKSQESASLKLKQLWKLRFPKVCFKFSFSWNLKNFNLDI